MRLFRTLVKFEIKSAVGFERIFVIAQSVRFYIWGFGFVFGMYK
ncbi:unknown [[Mannheimia] succiniciproducens MBEL55E]|uniref:Uncharacterized protein n=1 Tax=Mannheimia succiniciproducens (strain KCTC 0769BP / MBEL55E) TaxID=221988 RepID=Q65V27_MANSM|nr:unknown [[Mannheimia] succiniciproducens MBEL55E]